MEENNNNSKITLEFIDILKEEVSILCDYQITDKDLSIKLGSHIDYISGVRYRTKKSPDSIIDRATLRSFAKNLKRTYRENCFKAIQILWEYYKNFSSFDTRRILINEIIKILEDQVNIIYSDRKFSELIFDDPNYLTRNFFKGDPERPDISTIFNIEYRINKSDGKLLVDEERLKIFKEKSISLIRDFIFENEYIHENIIVEFNLIWCLFYAFTDFYGPKTTSGDIGRNILSGDYNYISSKLHDGNTIRSDSIEKIKRSLEILPNIPSKLNAIQYLDFYLQFRGIKDNPTDYDYRWDKIFWIHCYYLLKFQKGINIFTGEPLPDDYYKFLRHHTHFDKSSIKLYDLLLMTLESHNLISHPTRMGLSKDPKKDRELILHAISCLSRKPIKSEFWSQLQWQNYIERFRAYEISEEYFFKTYYKDFYSNFLKNVSMYQIDKNEIF